jgi:hypothetical protein
VKKFSIYYGYKDNVVRWVIYVVFTLKQSHAFNHVALFLESFSSPFQLLRVYIQFLTIVGLLVTNHRQLKLMGDVYLNGKYAPCR